MILEGSTRSLTIADAPWRVHFFFLTARTLGDDDAHPDVQIDATKACSKCRHVGCRQCVGEDLFGTVITANQIPAFEPSAMDFARYAAHLQFLSRGVSLGDRCTYYDSHGMLCGAEIYSGKRKVCGTCENSERPVRKWMLQGGNPPCGKADTLETREIFRVAAAEAATHAACEAAAAAAAAEEATAALLRREAEREAQRRRAEQKSAARKVQKIGGPIVMKGWNGGVWDGPGDMPVWLRAIPATRDSEPEPEPEPESESDDGEGINGIAYFLGWNLRGPPQGMAIADEWTPDDSPMPVYKPAKVLCTI